MHYLDNSATTAVDEDIAKIIYHTMTDQFGNPSSLHGLGLAAEQVIRTASEQIASCLNCKREEIYFTSGGTEANNLAVFGAAYAKRRTAPKIVTTSIEHSSVLDACKQLEQEGFTVTYIDPEPDGSFDVAKIADAVDEKTSLVTAMHVNNETGVILDIPRMVKLIKRKNPNTLVHCDAVQSFGKLPVSIKSFGVDLLTISGHKIHAPKGIGALYKSDRIRILPRAFGGEQQKKLRPGTESVPLIAGFAQAAKNACDHLEENARHVSELNRKLRDALADAPNFVINSPDQASAYVLNLSAPGLRSEILLHFLEEYEVYVSSGSACAKGAKSHVLAAMGLSRERIDSALRVSFCKYSTEEDVEALLTCLTLAQNKLFRSK